MAGRSRRLLLKISEGESSLCTEVLDQENLGPVCHIEDRSGVNTLDKNVAGIDIHLATDEIKREIVTMAAPDLEFKKLCECRKKAVESLCN